MPQISFPDIKLKDIGDRLHDVREDAHLPDELRDRLADAGDRISGAGGRLGDEVGDRLSDLHWSDLRLPDIKLPGALRDLRAQKVELPRNLPKHLRRELSRFEVPQVTIGKPKPSGPPMVPFVVLAAVAGVFVGWWLATSEFASGRVRSMIHQARVRLGMASEWDETVEERTEEFWGDERGWETASQPIGGTDDDALDTAADSDAADSDAADSDVDAGEEGGDSTSGWPANRYGNPGGTIGDLDNR